MAALGILSENTLDLRLWFDKPEGLRHLGPVTTPVGTLKQAYHGVLEGQELYYLPYVGICDGLSPALAASAAISFFHERGVAHVIGLGFAGAINPLLSVGDIVLPSDVIDFTWSRVRSLRDQQRPGAHLHFRGAEPFCSALKEQLWQAACRLPQELRGNILTRGTFVTTEGPRFETAAEIRAFARLGADLVGLTTCPEVFLAREMNMCYANLSLISNQAEGLDDSHCSWGRMREFSRSRRRDVLLQICRDVALSYAQVGPCRCRDYWYRQPTWISQDDQLDTHARDDAGLH